MIERKAIINKMIESTQQEDQTGRSVDKIQGIMSWEMIWQQTGIGDYSGSESSFTSMLSIDMFYVMWDRDWFML